MPTTSKSFTPNLAHHLPPAVSGVLASGGEHLPENIQAEMGSRFGHDFSKVRVHADNSAAYSAQTLGAQAYTIGQDIAFGAGKFAPETRQGRQLLAHELTHVIQQGRGASSAESVPTSVLEHDAHRAAAAFANGSAPIQVNAVSAPRISMMPAQRTALDIPEEGIDMPWVGNGAGVSSSELGYLRDAKKYWKEYAKRWQSQLSPQNMDRIKNGRSPIVDDTWLKAHPEHSAYKGRRLEHHHLGQGSRAVPLPAKLHDAYTTFHPQHQIVGEGTKPLEKIKDAPTGRAVAETARHIKEGRIKGPGIDPAAPPQHAIPRASALSGVPQADLKPLKPDIGIDSTGRAIKKAAPVDASAAPAPKIEKIETAGAEMIEETGEKLATIDAASAATAAPKVEKIETASAEIIEESGEKLAADAAEKKVEQSVAQNAASTAEKRVEKTVGMSIAEESLEKELRHAGLETTAEKIGNKALIKTSTEELEEGAVKLLESSAVQKRSRKLSESIIPIIGWISSAKDMWTGVEDIWHGHIALGVGTIFVAGVDVAADALHTGDLASGVGGTALSLTVQGWTMAMEAGLDMARTTERAKELREYIEKNGQLPPQKELIKYYGMTDEEAMLMDQALNGMQKIKQLTELPPEQMDAWVLQKVLERAEHPPKPTDSAPEMPSERLERYIQGRIAELEKQALTASPQTAQKLQQQRDLWIKMLPYLKPHIEHEKEVHAKQDKQKKIREYKEWKARVEAQKSAASPQQAAAPQGIGPFSMEKSPMQKADDAVKTFENWGLSLKIKGTALVNRIHKGTSPSDAERKAYAAELANWQSWLGKTISRLQQEGRSEAVVKLIAIRDNEPGPKLTELRGFLL